MGTVLQRYLSPTWALDCVNCLGHIRAQLAIVFGFAGFPFNAAAKRAIEQNKSGILREGLEAGHRHTGAEIERSIFVRRDRPFTQLRRRQRRTHRD